MTDVVSLTKVPLAPKGSVLSEQQLLHLYSNGAYQHIPELRQFVASVAADTITLIAVRTDTIAGSRDDETLIDHFRQIKQGLIIRIRGVRATTRISTAFCTATVFAY